MEKELNEIMTKLREANTSKDVSLIEKHVDELNNLWEENSKKIIKNSGKDGYHLPKKIKNES